MSEYSQPFGPSVLDLVSRTSELRSRFPATTAVRLWLLLILAIAVAGAAAAAWLIDRTAVSFLTGQRRVPGQDWFGHPVRMDGPIPGYVFLGFSRPSDDPPGFVLTRPADQGAQAGLLAGDIVTAVNGRVFRSSFEVITALLAEHTAGEEVVVQCRSQGQDFQLRLPAQPFYRTPADLQLPFEDVEILSKSGSLLRGWYMPSDNHGNGSKAVVFVHGATASRFQALDGAPFWHQRGYAVLAMDLSGRGTSDGDYVTYTVNERHDVASMIDWLSQDRGISPHRTVVFGTSNGAASAIYAAAGLPGLAGLILDAPYSDLWSEASEMLQTKGIPPFLLRPLAWAVHWRAGFDIGEVRPIDVIQKVAAPTLFIHGEADNQVRPYHSDRLHRLRLEAGLPSFRWTIPGGQHGFDNYPPAGEFWGRVVDFADQRIGLGYRSGIPEAIPGTQRIAFSR